MHELCLYPSQEQFTIYIWRTLFLEFYDTCKLKDAARTRTWTGSRGASSFPELRSFQFGQRCGSKDRRFVTENGSQGPPLLVLIPRQTTFSLWKSVIPYIRIDLFSCLACMFCFPNRGTRET